MVQFGLFLAALSIACSVGGLLAQPCSLTDAQKFSPSCESIASLPASTIYQGEEVTLNFHPPPINGTLHITNATILPSSADFCGVDSFSEGVTCSLSFSDTFTIQGACQDNPEVELSYGPAVLVLGFGAPYSCNVLLNVTWGQSELPCNSSTSTTELYFYCLSSCLPRCGCAWLTATSSPVQQLWGAHCGQLRA